MSEHLKCDADGCGHVEDVEAITEQHVGMACPACGANLLTEADWQAWKPIQALLAAVEGVAASQPDQGERTAVRIGLHGAKTTIEFDRGESS